MSVPSSQAESFRLDFPHYSLRALGRRYGISPNTARVWGLELGLGPRLSRQGALIQPELPDPQDPVLVEDLMQRVIALQETQQALRDDQQEAEVRIQGDYPAGILFWGDWHLGGTGTDHRGFLQIVEDLHQTPGLYAVGLGDYCDNLAVSPHRGADFEESVGPQWQVRLAQHYVTRLRSHFLALVKGCHDNWTYRATGESIVTRLAQAAECVNLGHGGTLHLGVGTNTYDLLLRHIYPYRSGFNPGHSQRRQIDFMGPADIVAHAHLHSTHMEHTRKAGRELVIVRSGSHKILDEYGQKLAGYQGIELFPLVILLPGPGEKVMIPFADYRQGLPLLRQLRGE